MRKLNERSIPEPKNASRGIIQSCNISMLIKGVPDSGYLRNQMSLFRSSVILTSSIAPVNPSKLKSMNSLTRCCMLVTQLSSLIRRKLIMGDSISSKKFPILQQGICNRLRQVQSIAGIFCFIRLTFRLSLTQHRYTALIHAPAHARQYPD